MNQLEMELEEKKKEVENLKTSLEETRAEVEEKLNESQEKSKEVEEFKAALDRKRTEVEERDKELEEMKNEIDELNKCLEEKSREADECMDKYCNLMVQVHKLEEANDALTTRLEHITNSHRSGQANGQPSSCRPSGRKSSSKHQEETLDENVAPQTPKRSPRRSSSGKRGHRDISDRDGVHEALHNLTKKIKANAAVTPKVNPEAEDEEFRPEGLPELVQKGERVVVSSVCVTLDTPDLFFL